MVEMMRSNKNIAFFENSLLFIILGPREDLFCDVIHPNIHVGGALGAR